MNLKTSARNLIPNRRNPVILGFLLILLLAYTNCTSNQFQVDGHIVTATTSTLLPLKEPDTIIPSAIPFGISNALKEKLDKLPAYLSDLGLSEKNGVAGFVVEEVSRKDAETCVDEICSEVQYSFYEEDKLIEVVVERGRADLWIVIRPVTFNRFTDGKLREDGKTYLPDGPISREAYRKYLTNLVNHITEKGREKSGNSNWHVLRWNLFNEVASEWNQTFGKAMAAEKYAEFVLDSSKILRDLSSKSEIVLGGLGSNLDLTTDKTTNAIFYTAILDHLYGRNLLYSPFDLFESHWFDEHHKYSKNRAGFEVTKGLYAFSLRRSLADKGVVIRAGATYTGQDLDEVNGLMNHLQSEAKQAEFLIKRAVYNLAQGAKAVPWSLLDEHKDYQGEAHKIFNFTGLIYSGLPTADQCNPVRQKPCPAPASGIKKLAYYSYKLLVEMFRGADVKSIEAINTGADNLFLYKLMKSDGPLYIAWWDYFNDTDNKQKVVNLPAPDIRSANVTVTEAIPYFSEDFQSETSMLDSNAFPRFFKSHTTPVTNGSITVTFGTTPIYIDLDEASKAQFRLLSLKKDAEIRKTLKIDLFRTF